MPWVADKPWRRWFERHAFPGLFMLLLVASLLPLTAEYLPFSDLPGHMGLVGAMSRWNEPDAAIPRFYSPSPHPILHSLLFEYLGAVFARFIPVTLFTNLFIAIFYVAALPLSVLALLRAHGRDPRLSLLVFPFVYVRVLWFGFVDYVAAVPLVLIALALTKRICEEPGSVRPRAVLLLALCATLLVFAHFFGALVFYGLCLIVIVCERPRPAAGLGIVLALLPGWCLLIQWSGSRRLADPRFLWGMVGSSRSFRGLLQSVHEWSIAGIPTPLADVVLLGFVLSLLAATGWSLRRPARSARDGRGRLSPLALLLVTVAMFFFLPFSIRGWWAVNVRLIPFVVAFAILAIPAPRRPIPLLFLLPAICGAVVWSLYLAWDFHHWFAGVEMAGFDETVDAIPKGKAVLALWPDFEGERHYSHFPLGYAGDLYVARRGGLAFPLLNGPNSEQPLRAKVIPVARPKWGAASQFKYPLHAWRWDYFLVKRPADGEGTPVDLFGAAPAGAVRLVAHYGLWSAYRNRSQ